MNGLHLLLTYQCTFECDHCFVWSGPFQSGTMTIDTVDHIIDQAEQLGTGHAVRQAMPRSMLCS